MQFAEIFLAIMNATVSKIFTEIFLESVSKQSKCNKSLIMKVKLLQLLNLWNHFYFLSRLLKIAILKNEPNG